MTVADPIVSGLQRGWHVYDAGELHADLHLEADVAIVGTGAGGGTAAEILSAAGLRVVLIEEGPLKSSRDFHMLEREAYPQLYQASAARQTKDKAITILQGRNVGGSTTVNWTASFRTPPATLAYWRERYGLRDYTPDLLEPWFARMERRLGIRPWRLAPNENNAVLQRGAARLGVATGIVPRNVTGCANLGYCGLGCPINAKQSMLVTTIPAALDRGALLVHRARAERLIVRHGRVSELRCIAVENDGTPRRNAVSVAARAFVAAAGGIGTPALLLRSEAPDPYGLIGKRTFLHPVVLCAAVMPERVDAFSGAPQSVYSDHFLTGRAFDGPIAFKLEVPPVHPLLMAVTLPGFGAAGARLMADLPHTQVILALLRDGFHDDSQGGRVELASDGSPVLDYPLTDYVWEGARRAFLAMAEIQFAAGAASVLPVHESARPYRSWPQARAEIASLPLKSGFVRVVSAHVMGGCAMGGDERTSVVDGDGRHRGLDNLYVVDGSVFPTSLGVNPQLSIFAIAGRMADALAGRLGARRG